MIHREKTVVVCTRVSCKEAKKLAEEAASRNLNLSELIYKKIFRKQKKNDL